MILLKPQEQTLNCFDWVWKAKDKSLPSCEQLQRKELRGQGGLPANNPDALTEVVVTSPLLIPPNTCVCL